MTRVQTMLNHIRFVFYLNINNNERNLCRDLLTIENTDLDLKVHSLNYANELLVLVKFSLLSFQKLLQTRSTYWNITRKNVWEKSNDAYSLSIRVQTTINHIWICFFTTISISKKMFFQRVSWKRHWATHWHEQLGMDSYLQQQSSQSDCSLLAASSWCLINTALLRKIITLYVTPRFVFSEGNKGWQKCRNYNKRLNLATSGRFLPRTMWRRSIKLAKESGSFYISINLGILFRVL